jgi:hypothetical protein
MKMKHKSETGQAIVMIVFGMVALIGVVALAIDGGNSFSDRRHAQNAADTAALAAALAKISNQNWVNAGLERAASNGYENDGVTSIVTISSPPGAGCGDVYGAYAGNDEYVQVVIDTTVDLFFAPIIGIKQTHSCVEAIARARPGRYTSLFYGNAIAATACHGSGTVTAWGSANMITIDGGVFSNSDAPDALKILKSSNLQTPFDIGISAVGGIQAPSTYPSPRTEGVEQIPCPLPDYMLPQYTCDYTYGDFPPEGVTNLDPGVYCISGDFTKANITGVGVTFVMLQHGIKWNGNSTMHLSAPTEGPTKGLLLYLPPSNSHEIKLNGTFNLDITGSVFAPSSDIVLIGDFSNVAMRSQWIGRTVDMSGSLTAVIQFNETDNYQFPDPAKIELTK